MPVETPLVPGDVPYPQYSVTDSEFVKQAVAIVKGEIYTIDAAGRLIAVTGTGAVADLSAGAVQARDALAAPAAEDTDEVQVLKRRSRILMKADANLVPGNLVNLKCVGGTVTPDKVQAAASPKDDGYLGTIYGIYTLGTNGAKKQVTADDDLVEVDLEV